MVLGKVQCVEVVALGLGFGADDAREAQLLEDVADLVDDLRDDVDAAAPLGPAGQREIDVGERRGAALELELTRCDSVRKVAFEGIRCSPDCSSCLGIERGETFENIGEGAGFAPQELGLELLEPALDRKSVV